MTARFHTLRQLQQSLPHHLAERVIGADSQVSDPDSPQIQDAPYVLYFMRLAQRLDENPALDTALLYAARLGLPLVIFQQLLQDYPHACTRKSIFQIENAVQLHRHLAETRYAGLDIQYLLHVERLGSIGSPLMQLALSSACTITDYVPLEYYREQVASLQSNGINLTQIDASCLFPQSLTKHFYDRAFEFRKAIFDEQMRRAPEPWPDAFELARQIKAKNAVDTTGNTSTQLDNASRAVDACLKKCNIDPVDLDRLDIKGLLLTCNNIDHRVGPVLATRGGIDNALVRWMHFLKEKIGNYALNRNDPMTYNVSRMSPYLHFGQISPFKMIREALQEGSEGAHKFVDEMLIWREVSFNFCHHNLDYRSYKCLPQWARESLDEHRKDVRPKLYESQELYRGLTSDNFWNLCQRAMLYAGELHNNVRMTWGKAFVPWTIDPETAMSQLEFLNNRLCLDGHDPASYGGLWWCLGLFDRAWHPDRPVLGRTRPRPTSEHMHRLSLDDLAQYLERLSPQTKIEVVVASAGKSASNNALQEVADILKDNGYKVLRRDVGSVDVSLPKGGIHYVGQNIIDRLGGAQLAASSVMIDCYLESKN